MPMHEYDCPKCRAKIARIVNSAERDDQTCDCGYALQRVEISLTQPGRSDNRYQMKAILSDGSKVDGQFGREARKNKGSTM